LGDRIAYAGGADYDDYPVYRDELVPAWCRQFFRVAKADGGRWCINVPIDITGRSGRCARADGPREPRPIYADWLQALLGAGFSYRTTILWDDGQAGRRVAVAWKTSPNTGVRQIRAR
jgi:hypothetical protein